MTITLVWDKTTTMLVGVIPPEDKEIASAEFNGNVNFQDIELGDYHEDGLYNAGEFDCVKCSGGCGKEVGDHPGAIVTCIDCAMDAASEARAAQRENNIKSGRLAERDSDG